MQFLMFLARKVESSTLAYRQQTRKMPIAVISTPIPSQMKATRANLFTNVSSVRKTGVT